MASLELNIEKLVKSVDTLIETLDKVNKSLEETASSASTLDKIFGKNDGFKEFINTIDKLSGVQAKNFKMIASGLTDLIRAASGLGSAKISDATNLLSPLITVLNMLERLPGSNAASKTARTIDKLSNSLKRINDLVNNSTKGIKPGTARRIALVYGSIGLALKAISTALSVIPGEQQVDLLSRVFDRIGRGLRAFERVEKSVNIQFLLRIFKLIGSIALSLRIASKVAGRPARLKGFGDALSGMASFFEKVSKITGSSPKQFKDFRKNIREVALGFKELSKIKFNRSTFNALNAQIGSLQLGGGGPSARRIATGILIRDATLAAGRAISGFIQNLTGLRSAVTQTIRKLGSQTHQFADTLQNSSRNLIQNFGIGRFFNSSAVQATASFDELSSQIQAFGNLTEEQTKRAQDFASELGKQYPLSANEALQATLNLIKAGLDLSKIEFVLPNAADLSSLGENLDINKASEFLIAFEGAFDEFTDGVAANFDNIQVATDIVAAAAGSSTASVDNLSAGIARVGPAARDAETSLEEVSAALALLDRAQIKGVEGGTALRGVFNSLVRPQSREELNKLNVALINADGSQRSLNQVVTDLAAAYERLGFSQAEIRRSLGNIAEVESRAALSVLVANGGLSSQLSLMEEIAPASERAEQMLDNFRGQTKQLTGSIQTLTTKAFLPLFDRVLTPGVKILRSFVDGILELPEPVLETAATMALIVSSVATLIGGFGLLSGVVLSLTGGFLSLIGMIGSVLFNLPALIGFVTVLSTSLVVVLPIIAGVGAGLVALSSVVNGMFRVVKDNASGAGDSFRRFAEEVGGAISEVIQFASSLVNVFFALSGNVRQVERRGERTAAFFDHLATRTRKLRKALSDIVEAVELFNLFLNGTGTKRAFAEYEHRLDRLAKTGLAKALFGQNVTASRLDRFFRDTMNVLLRIRQAASDIGAGIVDVLFGTGDLGRLERGIRSSLTLITQLIQNTTSLDLSETLLNIEQGELKRAVGSFGKSILESLKNFILQNKDVVVQAVKTLFNFAFNPFSLLEIVSRAFGLDGLANIFESISDVFATLVGNLAGTVIDVLGGQNIGDALLGNFGEGARGIVNAFNIITTAINGIVNFLVSIVQPAFDLFISTITKLWTSIQPSIEQLRQQFVETLLPQIADLLVTRVMPVLQLFANSVTSLFTRLFPVFQRFVEWLVNDLVPQIISVFTDSYLPALSDALRSIGVIWASIQPLLEDILVFFISKVVPVIQNVIEDIIVPLFQTWFDIVRLLINVMTPVIVGVIELFKNVLWPPIKIVYELFYAGINQLIKIAGSLIRAFNTPIRFLATLFSEAFGVVINVVGLANDVINLFVSIGRVIAKVLSIPLQLLAQLFSDVFNWIKDNVLQRVINVAEDFIGLIEGIWDRVKSPVSDFRDGMFDVINNVIERVQGGIGRIQEFVDTIEGAVDKVKSLLDQNSTPTYDADEFLSGYESLLEKIQEGDEAAESFLKARVQNAVDIGDITSKTAEEILERIAKLSEETVEIVAKTSKGVNKEIKDSANKAKESVDDLTLSVENFDRILGNPKKPRQITLDLDVEKSDLISNGLDDITLSDPFSTSFDEEARAEFDSAEDIRKDNEKARHDDEKRQQKSIEQMLKNERKRQRAFQQAIKDITEIEEGYQRDRINKIDDFNFETERRIKDHELRIRDIRENAAEELLNASINKNAAAAQAAVKDLRESEKVETEKFNLEERRRQEDLQRELAEMADRKSLRIQEAQTKLEELRLQHAEQREEEHKNHQELLVEIREREAERLAEEQKHTDTVIAIDEQKHEQLEEEAKSHGKRQLQIAKAINNSLTAIMKANGNTLVGQFGGFLQQMVAQAESVGLISPRKTVVSKGSNAVFSTVRSSLPPAGKGGAGATAFGNVGHAKLLNVPVLATGGFIHSDGLVYLHAGEAVLNRRMTEEAFGAPQRQNYSGNSNSSIVFDFSGMRIEGGNLDKAELVDGIIQQAERRIVPNITRALGNHREARRNV